MHDQPGVYVHFPWCVRKCPYCDFNSHPLKDNTDFSTYVDALIEDLDAQLLSHPGTQFVSVFLGGGTPSLFPAGEIARLIDALPLAEGAEVTMEANPGTVEHADFSDYRAAGVNRLSIGAQSFNDAHLIKLGRIHSATNTSSAFAEARAGGFDNINLDIMWGLPGQRVDDALTDLRTAIELEPEHLSWYQLTIEPKTEFAQRPPLLPVEDDLYRMEQAGLKALHAAGYERYEVSAFARNGRYCRHNLNYWTFGDYLGVGAGAHGKVSEGDRISRSRKASQPRLYLENPTATVVELVPDANRLFEFMMNALRLQEGASVQTFEAHTGLPWRPDAEPWRSLAEEGLVDTARPVATALGYQYLDTVLGRLLGS